MRKINNILLTLLTISLFSVCAPEQTEVVVPQTIEIKDVQNKVISSSNNMAVHTFKIANFNNSNNNIITSPISINSLKELFIFSNASGKISSQNGSTNVDYIREIKNFNNQIVNLDKDFSIKSKTSLIFTGKQEFKPAFADYIRKNNMLIAKNDSAFKKSQQNLMDIHQSLSINFSFANQTGTSESPFYLTPGESKFVTMHQCDATFNFFSSDYLKVIEVPIGQGNFNAVFIIPETDLQLESVANALSINLLNNFKENYRKLAMTVYIPYLNIHFSYRDEYKRYFPGTGKNTVFERISKNDNIYLRNLEYSFNLKSRTKINHKKTKSKENRLFIDKPFILVITEKYTNAIILAGKIINP